MKKTLILACLFTFGVFSSTVIAKDNRVFIPDHFQNVNSSQLDANLISPYITSVQKELKSNWFPHKFRDSVEVVFKINKKGQFKQLRLVNPSKNKEDNQAAIDAVMYASPFKPLPDNTKQISVKFRFPAESRSAQATSSEPQGVLIN